jgi:hypothetical protein
MHKPIPFPNYYSSTDILQCDISPIYNSPTQQFANMAFRQHTNVGIFTIILIDFQSIVT